MNESPRIYLDNAATAQKPRVVIDAVRDEGIRRSVARAGLTGAVTFTAFGAIVAALARRRAEGTGPFTLARWVQGDRIELARNPDYWGEAPALESETCCATPLHTRTRAKSGWTSTRIA